WNKNKTGFHASEINEHLERYWNFIGIEPKSLVFVPLCGKSLDMVWLAEQGYKVLGVEASEKACLLFFEQASLDYSIFTAGDFKVYKGVNIEIWCGDFFKLRKKDLPDFNAVYDRAALVAMPPGKRPAYINKIKEVTNNNLIMLLVSFTYHPTSITGPPFNVPEEEIRDLMGSQYTVMKLDSLNVLHKAKKFQNAGLLEFHENSYLVKVM
ncbi:MAG: thiopurine S-methyltransferase, partial [Balneolales bacterium]